jgi:hypothetical protein
MVSAATVLASSATSCNPNQNPARHTTIPLARSLVRSFVRVRICCIRARTTPTLSSVLVFFLSCGIDAAAGRSVILSSFKLNWVHFWCRIRCRPFREHPSAHTSDLELFSMCNGHGWPDSLILIHEVLETVIASFLCVD